MTRPKTSKWTVFTLLLDAGLILWLQGYAYAYLFGVVGHPSEKLMTIMLFLAATAAMQSTLFHSVQKEKGHYDVEH